MMAEAGTAARQAIDTHWHACISGVVRGDFPHHPAKSRMCQSNLNLIYIILTRQIWRYEGSATVSLQLRLDGSPCPANPQWHNARLTSTSISTIGPPSVVM